ncbi:extracellular calcium-sensing receptor-like [Protopterus annectens]|uniref:extracellular calcium-sensing receptor-like n=1 Tax=Protopterus annectens TaxID=7888 RepID=UPI001CF9834B|nr:extracellular calcium-sensing receptor-like [Protopterus annectens]
MLGVVFATHEINQNKKLLTNITLGFNIYDSCYSESRATWGTLALLSGTKVPVPGYICKSHPVVVGVIGELMSSLSVSVARILGIYHFPQISHGSMHSSLSQKSLFPSFLRTVTNYLFPHSRIAQLIRHFGWTWVGILTSDNELGEFGGQYLKMEILRQDMCIDFMEKIHIQYSKERLSKIIQVIRKSTANVIIVNSDEVHAQPFIEALYSHGITVKVLVFTCVFIITPGLYSKETRIIMNSTLGLSPFTGTMPGFKEFLQGLNPSAAVDDIFIKPFWEKVFPCKWQHNLSFPSIIPSEIKNENIFCTGMEKIEETVMDYFELNDLSFTYHTYLAVYAFASALSSIILHRSNNESFTSGYLSGTDYIQPWQSQVLQTLKNVHLYTTTGEEIYFDENGDAVIPYEIVNIQILQDGTFRLVKVGRMEPRASSGKEVSINVSAILWNENYTEAPPLSVCSESCLVGYRKILQKGQPVCCFDCTPCSSGEITNVTDSLDCWKCPQNQWPNENRDACIPKVIEFLSFAEPLGTTLAVITLFMTLLNALVLGIFIKHRDTPIVKANNRELSYLLLLGLMLCFLCSLIFIGNPTATTCLLRQTIFGIIFSFSISLVLAKTIIVVIAFKAARPDSKLQILLGPTVPKVVVCFCFIGQFIICAAWLLSNPPFVEYNAKYANVKIVIECNEHSVTFFYCMLGYLGCLAVVCFVVAFLVRNLPDTFNEAKFITFSMLVFVSVWLSFIPAYLSTQGKYMVAVEIFAILASSAGILSCIFLPKCYIILLQPQKNTRKHLMGTA